MRKTDVIAEIVADDELIVEAQLQRKKWGRLTIQCKVSGGCMSCDKVCDSPCVLAKRCIEYFIPLYFLEYAKWN